ncbi:hypothetical protein CW304_29675 [Bacillus sp. UFRGS-B20]|nr:hypothetical protein CW304_29675 [Bacillus sp. UFRGS-B20]
MVPIFNTQRLRYIRNVPCIDAHPYCQLARPNLVYLPHQYKSRTTNISYMVKFTSDTHGMTLESY